MKSLHLYDQIAKNKRASIFLVVAISTLFLGMGALVGYSYGSIWLGFGLALGFCLFYIALSYFSGDWMVLKSLGAKPIQRKAYPQLYNVVEEMAIAAGLPLPKIYVIQSSASNAFATGISPKKASVAITTGLLEILNREELQAVMAHEMSHVKNLDTRFALLMGVMVGSIVLLCDASWRIVRVSSRGSSRSSGQAQIIALVVALALAILAPIGAKIIQMAMSRRRELLADNTAAELTRNPGALANALEKIAHDPDPLQIANRGTQHLFIVNPIKLIKDHKKGLKDVVKEEKAGWFDSHPPIGMRINILRKMAKG